MRPVTLADYRERMLRVLLHIQEHLDEELTLEDLARVADFSPCHFHRIFSGMIGESVAAHIRRIRLERAALRLKRGGESILSIALEAGYESHEAFTRAFRAAMGRNPSDYRASVHYAPERLAEELRLLEDGGTAMEAQIRSIEAMRVAFVRHVGPYDQCARAWETLCGKLGPRGLLTPETRFMGLSHDDPEVTPADRLRYDACATVPASFESEGEVGVQEIGGGDYAVTLHQGPYTGLAATYAVLCGQWIPRQGRMVGTGPSLEVYLNDPGSTRPADLRTEVCMPLEPLLD